MQKVIKFRGKRKDNGEWVIGNYVSTSDGEVFILIDITGHIKRDDYEVYMVEVIPETVGQFTGLKDKNGVDIFEGDRVQLFYYDNYKNYTYKFEKSQVWLDGKYSNDIKEVKFINGSFVIWSDLIKDYRNFSSLARPGECFEIIGNIHEQPITQESAANALESASQDNAMEVVDEGPDVEAGEE